MGTLGTQSMIRIAVDGAKAKATELQRIYTEPYRRIRDVKQGPDGWLYLVTNAPGGAIIRLERE
jgi:glucose/arabinose dehydrogenase